MSHLKDTIITDMKIAMKAKDKLALITIRMLLAAIKQKEIDNRIELSDSQVLVIVNKMIKQRRDSIEHFSNAKRDDLVAKEAGEIKIIAVYMPKQKTEAEVITIIDEVIAAADDNSMASMGKIMAILKNKLDGLADMSIVSKLVRGKLK